MSKMTSIRASGAVPGFAIGYLHFVDQDFDRELSGYQALDPAGEMQRFLDARAQAVLQTKALSTGLRKDGQDEQADLLEALGLMLSDGYLESQVEEKIQTGSITAPAAVLQSSVEMADQISALDDAYLRERAVDIRNAGNQIVRILLGVQELQSKTPVILCGDEIDPARIVHLSQDTAGLVIGSASITSHAVILAKSKDLPTLVGVQKLREQVSENTRAILDSREGLLLLDPDEATEQRYAQKAAEEQQRKNALLRLAKQPARTQDGFSVTLAANIGYPEELERADPYGFEGVGLFRTEFLFLGRDTLPDEEEQFSAYRRVIERCGEHRCVIRTMDIGGDKPLPSLQLPAEQNPFLGWRALRISLERPDLFQPQLRAILRAGVYGKAAILLPMVTGLPELRAAKRQIARAMQSLDSEGISFARDIEVGVMVETPAAALIAGQLAKECDFFSIGTNDLTQYTLAADRGNPKVSGIYSNYHPAVLRLIRQTAAEAHAAGIWVAMCGEMAGDPAAARLLCSWGIDELSMSLPQIPVVRQTVRACRTDRDWADNTLALADADEVKAYLNA